MSSSIRIDISGGNQEETLYVSSVVERSLTGTGFTQVQNTISAVPKTDAEMTTIYDYARQVSPNLFATPITIGEPEDAPDEVEADVAPEDELDD